MIIEKGDMAVVRKHIYFSGRVQGVGFRYRACCIAQSLGLTGWVKNLWDGRVEMEVQGTRHDIVCLLEQLHRQPFIEIEDMDIDEIPCVKESDFREVY